MERHLSPTARGKALSILAAAALLAVGMDQLARCPLPRTRHPRVVQSGEGGYFRRWRDAYLERLAKPDRLGLVRGMFLGDDDSVSRQTRELFREAGLSHLLAASGFNCWIVAVVFALAGGLLLHVAGPWLPSRVFLSLRMRGPPAAKLAGAWVFWLWSDRSAPITRCALLASIQFALELAGFRAPLGRLLLVQYLASLAVVPRLWRSASFQLTFGCLFGILAATRLARPWRPSRGRPSAAVWDYACASIGACLGTIPTTWIVFGEINFTSLLTNWLAVPPVSLVIMPAGIGQMLLLAPGAPWAGTVPAEWTLEALTQVSCGAAEVIHKGITLWMSVVPALRYVD